MATAIDGAVAKLRDLLGDRLSTGSSVRELHARDEAYTTPALPDAVAFPECAEEVAAIARICAGAGCPIVPYGIGTSLEGHVVPVNGGVSVDFSRMNRILEIDERNLLATVEPGVTREQLNEELRATGLMFTVDPGANATIGGMTTTRASGTNAVRYGTMRENVMALEVVLPDGQVIETGTRARKSSAGYDLTHLFVGSEGTLGLITRVTVRLFGQPEAILAATCAFDTVDGAVDSVMDAMQAGLPMAQPATATSDPVSNDRLIISSAPAAASSAFACAPPSASIVSTASPTLSATSPSTGVRLIEMITLAAVTLMVTRSAVTPFPAAFAIFSAMSSNTVGV